MARKLYSPGLLLFLITFAGMQACLSQSDQSTGRPPGQPKVDSCAIAKPFENIAVAELLVKPGYTGALNNYRGDDTTKLDFTHFFEQGKLTRSVFYFENGRVQEEYAYKCGALHGMQQYYYENGVLAKKIPFSYGYRQGTGELFDEKGVLRQQVIFVADSVAGEPKNFNEKGELIQS